ncbi:hypothetical protein GCM10022379_07360 [Micromonospora maritima]
MTPWWESVPSGLDVDDDLALAGAPGDQIVRLPDGVQGEAARVESRTQRAGIGKCRALAQDLPVMLPALPGTFCPARSRPSTAGGRTRACGAWPAWILVSSGLTPLATMRTSA